MKKRLCDPRFLKKRTETLRQNGNCYSYRSGVISNWKGLTERERLGCVCNPPLLKEGTEMLCQNGNFYRYRSDVLSNVTDWKGKSTVGYVCNVTSCRHNCCITAEWPGHWLGSSANTLKCSASIYTRGGALNANLARHCALACLVYSQRWLGSKVRSHYVSHSDVMSLFI